MRTLVLWDIDHTLINAGGLSGETLHRHGIAPTPSLTSSFLDALASGPGRGRLRR